MNFLQNGTLTTYEYDMANRLTEIEHSANGTPFYTVGYTLNSVGNRTSKSRSGSAVFNGPVTEVYDYDAIDQLIEADYGTGKIEDFQYDAVGNREQVELTESGSTTTTSYTANALNQYTAVGTDLPSYDARGNLTSQSGWSYAYDSKNRLLSATDGATTASFVYDYRNRQVSRTIDGETMYFVWDNWSLLEDRDGQLEVEQQYVHGPVIDELLVATSIKGSSYYHRDGVGSAIALTDTNASMIESYTYDVFGVAIRHHVNSSGSGIANRFTFTGRESIKEVGLLDYRNRCYLVSLGRFLQVDKLKFRAGDINLYRYVNGNPVLYADPSGEFAIALAPAAAFIGAAVVTYVVADHFRRHPPRLPKPRRQPKPSVPKTSAPVLPPAPPPFDPPDGEDEDCDRQWEEARKMCEEELAKPNPCKGITGGYTNVNDCAKGLVTEDCGGNPIE